MLQDFQNIFQVSISLADVVRNLFTAFICGMLISWFYRKTYHGPGYLNTFLNSMVILSMVTAVVIMVIGNNLARAFGLVGAMSIIRFRTAVKETHASTFIFFSLAIGMAAGVGLHKIAIAGTVLIGSIAWVLSSAHILTTQKKEFLLQFTFSADDDDSSYLYQQVIDKFCSSSRLINAKSLGENGTLELSFYVTLKRSSKSAEFIRELKKKEGVGHVNLFFDEEYF